MTAKRYPSEPGTVGQIRGGKRIPVDSKFPIQVLAYEAILPTGFSHVSPCFPYHGQAAGESDADYAARLADELEAEFQRIGSGPVIAFVAETVVGATAGCVAPVAGYFPAVRAVCDRHGALLILDEVMCGMGRTDTTYAWEQEGVTPDLQAVAKGLGGGYAPVGALLVSRKVVDALSANADYDAMVGEVDIGGKTVEAVADEWLAKNESVWSAWLVP